MVKKKAEREITLRFVWQPLPLTRWFTIPLKGADFWVSARLDLTTYLHFLGGFLASAIFTVINLALMQIFLSISLVELASHIGAGMGFAMSLGRELQAGTGNYECMVEYQCKQGFNFFDLAVGTMGALLWILI
jgi:hypothetical protein